LELTLFICHRLQKRAEWGFIVFARDDLSGWVEGHGIRAADAKNVTKFIYEDVICWHGCPWRVVLDRGSENLNLMKGLLEHYRIQRTVVSAYHLQSNGPVEHGHDSIVNSLSKYYSKRPEEWAQYLPLTLWRIGFQFDGQPDILHLS
jgi:hypothetical protein